MMSKLPAAPGRSPRRIGTWTPNLVIRSDRTRSNQVTGKQPASMVTKYSDHCMSHVCVCVCVWRYRAENPVRNGVKNDDVYDAV